MNRQFYKSLKTVAIIHAGVLIVILVMSGWHRLFGAKQEQVIPVEFVVDVSGGPEVSEMSMISEVPDVTPVPDPRPSSPPRETHKPPKIEVSDRRIRKPGGRRTPTLSEAEIRRLLAEGAKAGDHTSIPADEETRCVAIIRQTVQPIWARQQPRRDEVGDAMATVEFRIGAEGVVTGRRITRTSGVSSLDQAAMSAASKVTSFRGLTATFIRRHPTYPVNFTAKPR